MTAATNNQRAGAPGAGLSRVKGLEWWLIVMLSIIAYMGVQIVTNEAYNEAWDNIVPGLKLTLYLTIGAFMIAMPLGLFIGMGRLSNNRIIATIAQVYIEFIRGMPMLVWLFVVAFVLTRDLADLINIRTRDISMAWRGGAALCLFYAAFIAEVFRAGIQSVEPGQIEAAKAVGLGRYRTNRHVVLPQALRNALPALGNDFIALMKDTSLVSVLAVGEITYEARIYLGSSFRIRESYFILAVIYVTLTLALSLLLQWWERHLVIPGREE